MDKSERAKLQFMITFNIGGDLFAKPDTVENLPLGANYDSKISKLNKRRGVIFNRLIGDLSKFKPEELAHRFSAEGAPISEESKSWAARFDREIDQSFRRLPLWYFAPLFRTKDLADFEYWGRSEFLSIDEVVWLSVGLEPTQKFVNAINQYNERGSRQKLDYVAEYMSRHKETIRRKFDPHDMDKRPDLGDLLDWIEAVNLEVHSGFTALLENKPSSRRLPAKNPTLSEATQQKDDREKLSMSKLIAAMAIDGYGYDPQARRSDIPNEIQGIADRMGLGISTATIRKYLKKGAELIPEEWEPE